MDLSVLAGFILPPIVDLVNNRVSDSRVRFIIALFICGLIAVLFHIEEIKDKDWMTVVGSFGIIFAEAQVVYKLYWDKSKERKALEKITG